MKFKDRKHAGKLLAEKLAKYKQSSAIALGLARGGVEVASVVASVLQLPCDVLVVKKLGSPMDPEYGIGAVAPDGAVYIDWKSASRVGTEEAYVNDEIEILKDEIKKRQQKYRVRKKDLLYEKREVILIDDGVATGSTMQAAVKWIQTRNVSKVILAVPVAPMDFIESMKSLVDEIVTVESPSTLGAVGAFYDNFSQVTDDQVVKFLKSSRKKEKTL